MDAGLNYVAFGFNRVSPLALKDDTEKLAYHMLGCTDVELQFYKHPIKAKDHPRISGEWQNRPDIKKSVDTGLDSRGLAGEHSVGYEIKSKQFRLRGHSVSSDPQYWEDTGNIVSIPDLLGIQMFAILPSIMVSGDIEVDQYMPEIRRRFELDSLIVSMVGGREFWFSERELRKYTDKDSYPIYDFTFPNTLEELAKLSR
jgi:hypothetical protein